MGGSATSAGLRRERGGPELDCGFLIALEPSAPSRRASVRLRRAVNTRGSLHHPNLLRAWPLGDDNGRLIVALERCAHPSLTDLLRSGPLEPDVCVHILAGAAAGADALMRRGLLARDVTPDAVFVHPEHGGVLADLAIAPELFRAPLDPNRRRPFASPEELRDQRLDARSTVYSLGVLLFTSLTRAHPYKGPWADVYAALAAGAAPAASRGWRDLPPGMDEVIARAITPNPERRYADAAELARAVAAHVGADAAPETAPADNAPDARQGMPGSNGVPEPLKVNARAPTPSARLTATSTASVRRNSFSRRRFALAAVAALIASAVTGVVLSRVVEADRGPSSVTGAGVTLELPPGWDQVRMNPGRPAVRRGIAVGPQEERGSGLVVGKLRSEAAAERMLADAQAADGGRTRVRLGELDAWRYAGLQPRPGLSGTGYLIPTADGVAVVICHAPKDAGAFLAECGRVASTVVLSGEQALPVPSVDKSRESLTEVVAALRSRRAKGLERLAAADRSHGQVRAAASLQRGHRRAAQSLDRIPPLENGQSLAQLSAAVRAAADAYGRVASAARTGRRSAYRRARRAVVRAEQTLRHELAQASGA